MNKAVIVLTKIPNSCSECICFSDHYSDMCCKAISNRTINYPYPDSFRQEWCPLKALPEKYDADSYKKDYQNAFERGFEYGFNYCLDKILEI